MGQVSYFGRVFVLNLKCVQTDFTLWVFRAQCWKRLRRYHKYCRLSSSWHPRWSIDIYFGSRYTWNRKFSPSYILKFWLHVLLGPLRWKEFAYTSFSRNFLIDSTYRRKKSNIRVSRRLEKQDEREKVHGYVTNSFLSVCLPSSLKFCIRTLPLKPNNSFIQDSLSCHENIFVAVLLWFP